MPLLNDISDGTQWIEPDDAPRPVVTYGFASDTFGDFELDPHVHAKSQLLLVQRGALSCEVAGGLWLVPPHTAIWIPERAIHAIKVTGALAGYGAFVAPDAGMNLPKNCSAVSVTPLLCELMIRSANLPLLYEEGSVNSRLIMVLLDELALAQPTDLHLSMPTDPACVGL